MDVEDDSEYEFRRKIWKNKITDVLVYSTAPVQRLTMAFKVKNIIAAPPQLLWDKYHEYSGMSREEFFKYFKNCDTGYAIEIFLADFGHPGQCTGNI
jgi:predicted transcriptional regulator